MSTTYIQITAGRGPAECAWVVAQVLKLFLNEARSMEFKVEVVDKVNGDFNLTLASATVKLRGDSSQVDLFLKSWEGTIQWIGKSQFRKYHKRKNWYVGLQRVPELKTFKIDESQITYTATRSGGPGGQHVNKVSTAIRAQYKALKLEVFVSESRSQHQNKKIAKQRLLELLATYNEQAQIEAIQGQWGQHNALQRGNPIRTFSGTNFKRKQTTKRFADKRKVNKQNWKKEIE